MSEPKHALPVSTKGIVKRALPPFGSIALERDNRVFPAEVGRSLRKPGPGASRPDILLSLSQI